MSFQILPPDPVYFTIKRQTQSSDDRKPTVFHKSTVPLKREETVTTKRKTTIANKGDIKKLQKMAKYYNPLSKVQAKREQRQQKRTEGKAPEDYSKPGQLEKLKEKSK